MKIRGLLLLFLFNFSLTVFAKNPHLIVHYWAHQGSPFGHISIEVKKSKDENLYLSYVMGNNLKQDLANLGRSETVELPLLSNDSFESYRTWWQNGPFWEFNPNYGKHYNFLTFNCAHAVSNTLKFLGYKTGWSDHHFALRPKQVWKKVKKLASKNTNSHSTHS